MTADDGGGSRARRTAPSGASPLPPLVLVVDDDDDFQLCVCSLLAEAGFRTESAHDGQEARDRLAAGRRPDAVLLDLMMPVVDGFTLLGEIRASGATVDLPVVVASASLRREESVPGATAVLRKPFDADALVALIGRLCAREDESRAAG